MKKYSNITVLDAAMVSAEDTLPREDCWLLTEKYANELPIINDIEKCYHPPRYEPTKYPMQWQRYQREPFNVQVCTLCKTLRREYDCNKRRLSSKKAKATYKYVLLAAMVAYTIYFCVWTFKYHNE